MENPGVNNHLGGDVPYGQSHVQAGSINGRRPDGREPGSRANFTTGVDGTVTDHLPKMPEYEVTTVDSEDQLPEGAFRLPNGEYYTPSQGIWAVRGPQEADQAADHGEVTEFVLPEGSILLPDQRYYIPEKGVFDERDLPEALGITTTGHVRFSINDTPTPAAGAQAFIGSGRVDAETAYTTEDGSEVRHSVHGYVSGAVHQLPPDFNGSINISTSREDD